MTNDDVPGALGKTGIITLPDELRDEAPAAKLLYLTLADADDALPFGELAERTLLAPSVCRRNLRRLEKRNLVRHDDGLNDDDRVVCYWLRE